MAIYGPSVRPPAPPLPAAASPDTFSPIFFKLPLLVAQWNLVFVFLMVKALWRFGFWPHFRKKKSRPPYKLSIFLWFPPQNFFIYHWYPNETWHTCFLMTWLYDVLVFYPISTKKNLVPPMDNHQKNIFWWFPDKKLFIITGIPMKLGIPAPYWHGFMTFSFFTPISRKK